MGDNNSNDSNIAGVTDKELVKCSTIPQYPHLPSQGASANDGDCQESILDTGGDVESDGKEEYISGIILWDVTNADDSDYKSDFVRSDTIP